MAAITNGMRSFTATVGWRFPATRLLSSRHPLILVYHGVPRQGREMSAEIFERQMLFLKQRFDMVPWEQIGAKRTRRDKVQVVLTFDDGFRNNAEVVAPILRRHRIPAVFFVCSRHAEPGRYLWFSYLRALEQFFDKEGFLFRGQYFDMATSRRHASVAQLWSLLLSLKPHPGAMYEAIEQECPRLEKFVSASRLEDQFAGMSAEQVKELATDPCFTIGIHTVDHPFLTKCAGAEIRRQIAVNKAWIEQHTGRKCELIAYPAGDFNGDVLESCSDSNLRYGFSVVKRIDGQGHLQLLRVGVYRESLDELGFKVRWGHLLTRMQNQGYLLAH